MNLTDTLTVDGMKRTRDGYLVASVRAARTGIQEYSGAEVGKPGMPKVRVYRPETEVFKKDAMASFTTIPVTVDHPDVAVTADNWRKFAVGNTGEDIARDGDFIRVPIIVKDAAAIRQIESGKRQLSMGYTTDLDWTPGTTPDGLTFDAIQTNLLGNHLAIVNAARGGSFLTIDGDISVATKTIVFDGLPLEITDAGEMALNKLRAEITKITTDSAAAATKSATDLSASAAKIATLDAEIATLKTQILTGDKLDAAVAERATLIADAKKIGGDIAVTGTNDEIKKRAVLAKLGDAYKDRDKAFFDAAFELQVVALGAADPVRDAIRNSPRPVATGDKMVADAYAEMVRGLTHPNEKAA